MKLIVAYIQPERLDQVKQALFEIDCYTMSVTSSLGCGKQRGFRESYRGAEHEVELLKKLRLEIGLPDELVASTVEAIIQGARTGNIGDGKIFVLEMPECIRIRTGEKDIAALS